jgi:hypothetical protein
VLGLGHYASECPNKWVMVVKDEELVESASKKSDCDDMPPLDDVSDLKFA